MAETMRAAELLTGGTQEQLSQEALDALLGSMFGMWTGWFDPYGGVDKYHLLRRAEDVDAPETAL